MRTPKKIYELLKSDKKRIQEENIDFYEEFIRANYGKQTKVQVKRKKLLVALSCFVLLTIMTALLLIPFGKSEMPSYSGDETIRIATLDEFQEKVPSVIFDFGDYDVTAITCIFDIPSSDDLYYNISLENMDTLEFIELKVSVNKYYTFANRIAAVITDYNIHGFNVNYTINNTGEIIYARVFSQDLDVYITYESYDGDLTDMFKEFINKTFGT